MSNKATYLGALMDAGVRALGIVGGASIGRSLGSGSVAMTGLGGVLGHEAAAGLLQRMGRNQYVSVGRRGVKPAKVRKQIIINEEDNMSKSLTESLINEGIRALREFNISGLGMQQISPGRQALNFIRNRTGGTPVGVAGTRMNRKLNNIGNNLSNIVTRSKEALYSKRMKRAPRRSNPQPDVMK